MTDLYTTEFTQLANLGATGIRIAETGGGITAIEAQVNGLRLLATNMSGGLLDADAIANNEPANWCITLYDIDDDEGDTLVAEGFGGSDFAAAYRAALDSLERGDVVA